jgi:alpha-tubulin suppressor-like RCC1 family protein
VKKLLSVTLLAAGLVVTGPAAHAQADPAPSGYTSVAPVRVLDTRTGAGPVGAGGIVTVDLSSRVPATASAVVLNVTGVTPTANTFVTVYPAGESRPTASSLNLAPGDTRPNQVTVTLGASHSVSLYNNAGSTHLLADLAGYYVPGTGAKFTALTANRMLDTRIDGGPLTPGETRVFGLSDQVPASATTVTFNLTATGATASTFVTAWPADSPRPNASNVNLPAGDTRANLVTVPIGPNRRIMLFNNAGSVNLLADVTGFYTPGFGALFVPRSPTRVLDTRTGAGPVGAGQRVHLDLAGTTPLTTTGALLNVTAVDATSPTFVTAFSDRLDLPQASTLNLSTGQTVPNAAMVTLADSRGINLYNNAGSVQLIADLAGVFVVPDAPCTTGCAYAWGYNQARKLGTGQAVPSSQAPAPVALSGIRALAASTGNGYALRSDGTVWAWGDNDYGQLGAGWRDRPGGASAPCCGSVVPAPVQSLTGVVAIATGANNGYALRSDGTVWAWGADFTGQAGNGAVSDYVAVPVQVTGLTNVVAIAGGGHTGYAVRADGTVWAWGFNGNYALGTGSNADYSTTPVQVTGLTGATAIAAGTFGAAYVLRSDGTVWSWGPNGHGQLGTGSADDVAQTPVQVSGLTGVTSIAAGFSNGYAVRNDGTAWAWGSNFGGMLGNGVDCSDPNCESRVPVQVANLTDVTRMASFDNGAYALRGDGTVWGWGWNTFGELGTDTEHPYSTVPVRATGLSGVIAITAAGDSGYVLVANS